MTNWATLLLVFYVSLGLSRMSYAKAVRVAALVTVLVIAVVMVRAGARA